MIICSWNVRGLNAPSKVVEVRRFLQKNNVDVVALVETRVREINVKKVQNKLGGEWKWEMNYSCSPKGRIWVGWRHSLITYHVVNKTYQFIHGVICTKTGLTSAEFTAVYGLHTIEHRKPLWVDLVNTADNETRDFERCIDAAGLAELKSCGHFFSWSNKGQGDLRISSRIDRALGCAAWHTVFDDAVVDHLNPGLSDHSPLVLTCKMEDHSKGRPFRLFNYMADHPSFNQVVQDGWKVNIQGTAMHQLAATPTDTDLQCYEGEYTRNSIDLLYDTAGKKLVTTEEIQKEICVFYKELVGSATDNLVGIDLDVVRKGNQLTADATQGLVVPVTNDEIDVSLAAVKEFFDTGKMLRKINNTSVTLIPKVQNATSIKDFRPIACCSIVYKLISKILTSRMQVVIGDVIRNAQSGFIPGRNISGNILLASELVKCYSRKYISPRCMIKVDLKKAYDSIEWHFLKKMLQELGFSSKFVNWIMQCLYSVSYSILVNGAPTSPIPAKKGDKHFKYHPRCKKLNITHMMFADDLLMFSRADIPSVTALFGAFTKFSLDSGLLANLHKSEVYTAGIPDDMSDQIVEQIGIPKGNLFADCKPLIEKIVDRVRSWTAKFLSYAGRLQLIKSVLFGIQMYWSQIFVMPKKVMKEIQRICRCFLWTGSDLGSKKAPVVWEQMCFPKSCGGWNLTNLVIWNKATVVKHLWALSMKQDRPWVKWIHIYYVKNQNFWSMPVPNGLTWSLRKIWHSRDMVMQVGTFDQFTYASKFKINKMYKYLHDIGGHVSWKRIICNSKATPKAAFIVWLALHKRLPTKDRLRGWGMNISSTCELCQAADESLDHLFFDCSVSKEVRSGVLQHLGVSRLVMQWELEVQWCSVKSRSTKEADIRRSIAFSETVYALWLQRNANLFKNKLDSIDCIVRRILFIVACRCE
ncbi:uncharacterized protein [Spinacia oleracea]|uniref:Reverse transcriptase domain-containing protein n=1 Tax=Spinacia oleracea TaxID=3562 RepID=A0ABM3QQK5_SPIOL|nr:uncharacterized protein LOC110780259 [Spinacia oleracea]